MADWLICKMKDAADPLQGLDPISVVLNVTIENAESAFQQAYRGEGSYVALRWDNRIEAGMTSGVPVVRRTRG